MPDHRPALILPSFLGSGSDERGQGLAEYALILGLIAVLAIVALLFMGNGISTLLSTIGNSL